MKPPEALRTQIVQAPKLNGKSNGKEPRLGQVKTVWAGILSKVGVKNDGQHLSKKSNKEEPKVPSYQRIGDANFSLEKYGASKPFTLTEEEQVSYSVSTPVVVARNPANIEPGIYFETRLTPGTRPPGRHATRLPDLRNRNGEADRATRNRN